jgi:hypothetical protein
MYSFIQNLLSLQLANLCIFITFTFSLPAATESIYATSAVKDQPTLFAIQNEDILSIFLK